MMICFANHERGTGKSALSFQLGLLLSKLGARVLLVDADPQGPVSSIQELSESGIVLDRSGRLILRSVPPKEMKVLCGFGAIAKDGFDSALEKVTKLKGEYDVILFDTTSEEREIADKLIRVVDEVFSPVHFEEGSFVGFVAFLERIKLALKETGAKFGGILPTLPSGKKEAPEAISTRDKIRSALPEAFPLGDRTLSVSPQCMTVKSSSETADLERSLESLARAIFQRMKPQGVPSYMAAQDLNAAETIIEIPSRATREEPIPILSESRPESMDSPSDKAVAKPGFFQRILAWFKRPSN